MTAPIPAATINCDLAPQPSPLPALRGNEPSASASRWFALSPEETLDLVRRDPLVDTMGASILYPGIVRLEGSDDNWGSEVGSARKVHLTDGKFVTETIVEILEGRGIRYTLTGFSNVFGALSHGVHGEWIAEPSAGGTMLHWNWAYPARNFATRIALKLIMDPTRSAYHRRTLRLMAQGLQQAADRS